MKPVCDYFDLLVSAGRTPHFSKIWKFGRNKNVSGVADLWSEGGIYSFMETEDYLLCNSDNADDSQGGDGAHKITLYGLNKDWKLHKEDIVLDGLNEVKSKSKYIRVFRLEVRSAGIQENNIGNLSIKNEAEGIVRAKIDPGDGQTLMAIYTIPHGYIGYLKTYYVNFTGLSPATLVNAELRVRHQGEVFRIQSPIGLQDNTSYISQSFQVPIGPYPGASDIKIRLDSNQIADVRGGFLLILEKGGKTYLQKGKKKQTIISP